MYNTRRYRHSWFKLRRYYKCKLIIFSLALLVVTTIWLYINIKWQNIFDNNNNYNFSHCQPIDIVYTWVNGSDPEFIKLTQLYDSNYDVARFDDKNELRYSLRSLEKYAPWVRHVYIVTNGQIPHWLDLNYDKVSIVPHELLAPHASMLPTFSSAAIETFLHRIPQLSEHFLYLNDDIFLNAPLYMEDLYTVSEGVRIYQAWMVPDCATDCPWTYIADGACDAHCNIAACQYDGQDCANVAAAVTSESMPPTATPSFRQLLHNTNTTREQDLKSLANNFNQRRLNKNRPAEQEPAEVATSTTSSSNQHATKDIYSQSLIYTNMLLNRHYGFKARNVLAHVGFLLQRSIVSDMQHKFAAAINLTQQHRMRATNDLQFAFAYYTYLMSEMHTVSVDQIFNEFDTDDSGTWSDREVRTFLARIYNLPLDWSAMRYFEDVINNCTATTTTMPSDNLPQNVAHPTLVYERYEDSNLPTISKQLVLNCKLLADALKDNFGTRPKYKYKLLNRRQSHSNFMMLTSNISEVVDALDKFRMNPRKFNCINDNLEAEHKEDNELIRQLLEDFYLSFFPKPSKFELPPEYRNRFDNWWQYLRWRRRKRAVLACGYFVAILLIAFIFRLICLHKAKIVRRCVQKL